MSSSPLSGKMTYKSSDNKPYSFYRDQQSSPRGYGSTENLDLCNRSLSSLPYFAIESNPSSGETNCFVWRRKATNFSSLWWEHILLSLAYWIRSLFRFKAPERNCITHPIDHFGQHYRPTWTREQKYCQRSPLPALRVVRMVIESPGPNYQ